jgi:hypothetical protein
MDEIRSNIIFASLLHGAGCTISIMTLVGIPDAALGFVILNYAALLFNAGGIVFWTIWYYLFRRKHCP